MTESEEIPGEDVRDELLRARRLREIDLDAFDGMGQPEIEARLASLAREAGPVILRAFLDGSPGPDDDPFEVLVERYVARRMRTINDMLHLKRTFRFEGEE